MRSLFHVKGFVAVLGLLFVLAAAAGPASAATYNLDRGLSLVGDCTVAPIDPVPDPSCAGEPPAYPPPPDGPSAKFAQPRAIAIDAFGNEYVASYADSGPTGRIDVFDDEGKFITEFLAPNVAKIAIDSAGNVYVLEDVGGIVRYAPAAGYDPAAGNIAYTSAPVTVAASSFSAGIAVDASNDHLFLTQFEEIQEFDSAAEGNDLIETTSDEKLRGRSESIVVDAQRRRLYVVYCAGEGGTSECGVVVLNADAPETFLAEIDGSTTPDGKFLSGNGLLALAVDELTGNLFVGDLRIGAKRAVYVFDENYEYVSEVANPSASEGFGGNTSLQIAVSNGERVSVDPCEFGLEAPLPGEACNRGYLFVPTLQLGRALAFEPPGVMTEPDILEVSVTGIGETEAELRARIDPQGAETQYTFQYTTQEAFEVEGFDSATVVATGTIPAANQDTLVKAFLTGLTPGQAYRFRVIADNEVGPAPEDDNEAGFTTYSDALSGTLSCPNAAFRVGLSAALPDCRAYELVTPPDTNGRAPKGVGFAGNRFPTLQASPSGGALSFIIEGGSLPGSNGSASFRGDLYLATRGGGGWDQTLAGPSGDFSTVTTPGSPSPDQGHSFWTARGEGAAVIDDRETNYVRYPDGRSELVGRGSLGTDPGAEGKLITEGGGHIIFETTPSGGGQPRRLEPEAPPTGTRAVYDRTADEVTHVVSLLPGDITPAASATYLGASADGEGIAFEIGATLYLRVGNAETHEIATGAEFAGVTTGGERIFYLQGGDLFAYDVGSQEALAFSTTGDVTPVNVATGGQRAYFVSPSVLGGVGPTGQGAQPGAQNLYLSTEGQINFIATLTDRDVEGEESEFNSQQDGLGLWIEAVSTQPAIDPSRLNPDGSVLVFQSRANLTGYDSGDFAQIYRYDSAANRLHCVSCIPTKTPATGGASLETYTLSQADAPPFSPSGFVPNLSPDGRRVFFESREALVSYDTDGVQDIYEWEEQGLGSCQRAGGCLYLISSGESDRDNFLYGHSQSGDDVFFTTGDRLTGQDAGGTISIYDARVGGGFPEPEPVICAGEGCRPVLTPPPALPSAAAPALGAEDNFKPKKPRRCPKGKRKVKRAGKVRCVAKKSGKRRAAAGKTQGAGR